MGAKLARRRLAIAALAAALGFAGAHAPAGQAESPAFIEAQRAEARGEFSAAESLYDRALEQDPASAAALMGRARMRSWLGRFEDAIRDYRLVVGREPRNAQALSGLGWTLAWNREFDEARRTFEYLGSIEPYYLDARKGLAYVELWRGNAAEARRQFEALSREDQGNPDYVLAIAQASYLQGDLPAAREAYRRALELDPELEAARSGLQAVEAAAIERRPAVTLLYGRSDAGAIDNSGIRLAQVAVQVNRDLRMWIAHDRGVGFDGFEEDRLANDAATTTLGGFYTYRGRLGTRVEIGVRDLVEETQPVFAAEQVFFLPGGTTPKVGIWVADGDEATQWVVNAAVHRWLGERFAIEPAVYFGDSGDEREVRGALLGTYTAPNRLQLGLGVAVGTKDTTNGNRSVDRIYCNASYPVGDRVKLLFYGWREGTEGFEDQTVIALGATVHL